MARRKNNANNYQPWPAEAGPAYRDIVRLHKSLTDDISTSIERGCKGRNKFILEVLIDYILGDCQRLENACQNILELLEEERKGRFPKWYTLTEKVQDKASELFDLAGKVKPALKRNELIYLEGVYDRLKAETKEIEKLLAEHPYRPGLEVWEEAAEIVNRKLER